MGVIVGLNKGGKKSGCIWQPPQLYCVSIMIPMLSIAFLHWFATFQTKASSTVKSDSIIQGFMYSIFFLPPLFNPSIVNSFLFLFIKKKLENGRGTRNMIQIQMIDHQRGGGNIIQNSFVLFLSYLTEVCVYSSTHTSGNPDWVW